MADVISTVAYVLTVLLFALHLIFDRRFRRQLRTLARQQHRLERRLAAMSKQDTWVVGNAPFSHAPWVLVRLSGQYYWTVRRFQNKLRLTATVAETASPQGCYRGCFDLYGFFGDVGAYGSLKDLSEDGCRLLKLNFPVVVEPEPESAVAEAVPDTPVVYPEVVTASGLLQPLFSSRFH